MIPRIVRGASLLAVLLAGWLLLASTPAAGGNGGSPADDPATDGVAVVGPAAERLAAPTALPRPTPWAALAAVVATVVLIGTVHRLRPTRAPLHTSHLISALRGRAPPAFLR
jgi:hypothetical protein